jgi:hypothetical protein
VFTFAEICKSRLELTHKGVINGSRADDTLHYDFHLFLQTKPAIMCGYQPTLLNRWLTLRERRKKPSGSASVLRLCIQCLHDIQNPLLLGH